MAVGDILKSGSFEGSTKLRGKVYWSQRETATPGVSRIIADLYFYTQYYWSNYALKGCIVNINGNMKTTTSNVNVAGSGERKVMSHSCDIAHGEGQAIRIETKLVINGTYSGQYYSDVYTMGTIYLAAPAGLHTKIKTSSNGYSNVKGIWVKTSANGYSKCR